MIRTPSRDPSQPVYPGVQPFFFHGFINTGLRKEFTPDIYVVFPILADIKIVFRENHLFFRLILQKITADAGRGYIVKHSIGLQGKCDHGFRTGHIRIHKFPGIRCIMTHVSRAVVNPVNLVRQGLPFPLLHSQTGQGQIAHRHLDTVSDTGCPAGSEIPGKNILKPLLISVPDQTDDLCFPLIQKLLQQMGPEKAGGACEKYGVFLLMNWPRCRYLPGIGRFYFFFLLSCAACEQSRLRPGRGIFVKPGHGHFHSFIKIPAQHAERSQGGSSLFKEGNIRRKIFSAQDYRPDPKKPVFQPVPRSILHCLKPPVFRLRFNRHGAFLTSGHSFFFGPQLPEEPYVHLPVGGGREAVHTAETPGHHDLRQAGTQPFPYGFLSIFSALTHIKGDQLCGAVRFFQRNHRRLRRGSGFQDTVYDFIQLYPLAVDFYLAVPSSQEFYPAVCPQASHIPALVHFLFREIDIRKKHFRRELRPSDIAFGDTLSRQIKLSRRRGHHRISILVKNVNPAVGKRDADGDPPSRNDLLHSGAYRRLRRPIHI